MRGKTKTYYFATDAVSMTIEASDVDAAVQLFVADEGRPFAGVATLDDLMARIDKIGDGATLFVTEDEIEIARAEA